MNDNHSSRSMSTVCFRRWTRKRFAIFASLHKVVQIAVITCTCSLVQLQTSSVSAQNKLNQQQKDSVDLDEVEVTGSLPLAVPQATRLMQVIQQHEIISSPAQGLDDLLETLPGLDIRQRGSEAQSDINIRGGSFDQVLILLNGVNITDPQTGHFNLDIPVNPENIKRIEVLQGSAARLWGANAFSGVINLVTDSPGYTSGKRNLSLETHIGSGSFGQAQTGATLQFNRNRFSSNLSVSYKRSDGYTKNTDYESLGIQSSSRLTRTGAGDFHLQAGYQQKDFGANSFYTFSYPNQYEQTRTLYGSFGWQKQVGNGILSARWNERLHHDRFELFRDFTGAPAWYTGHNYHLNHTSAGTLQLSLPNLLGTTVVGTEQRQENILSNVLGIPLSSPKDDFFDSTGHFTKSKTRTNTRLYADHTFYLEKLTVSGGLSVNLNSDVKTFTTGGIDAAYKFSSSWSIQANWNKAFRLPTFTDLYYQSAIQISNPNLKPEQSNTIELSVQYVSAPFKGYVTTFYRKGTNVIDWVKHPDSTKWTSRNETSIGALGGEITLEYTRNIGFLRNVRLSQTLLQLDKEADGFDSKYALDYLKQKTLLRVEHSIYRSRRNGDVTAVWMWTHQDRAGTYTNSQTNTLTSYKPFGLIDLKIGWTYKNWDVYLTGKNLTDTKYSDFGGLMQPGRSVMAGFRFKAL
jgi:vitamin B12 transporter